MKNKNSQLLIRALQKTLIEGPNNSVICTINYTLCDQIFKKLLSEEMTFLEKRQVQAQNGAARRARAAERRKIFEQRNEWRAYKQANNSKISFAKWKAQQVVKTLDSMFDD